MPEPYLQDPDVTLYCGDALETLRQLPDRSVHMCATSPPFFGLRDYQTGTWDGGDEGCDHKQSNYDRGNAGASGNPDAQDRTTPYRSECGKCGARRIDRQIGLEESPQDWCDRLVEVFREVRRVLRDDGTLWVEIGDSYATKPNNNAYHGKGPNTSGLTNPDYQFRSRTPGEPGPPNGCKPKDLLMQPALLAKALRDPYYTGDIKHETDRVWLAAMVDGEGSIGIHKRPAGQSAYSSHEKKDGTTSEYVRKQDSYQPKLEITNTNAALIERIVAITGEGNTNVKQEAGTHGRKQTIYRWTVTADKCRDLLRELYPHLVAKQHEARLAYGCPSSGEKAAGAHEALKSLHSGNSAGIDFPAPESMFEAGWFLRSEIIWARLHPNPMPESVTDRPTKAHSTVFLLSKSPRYFYDQEAIREPYSREWGANNGGSLGGATDYDLRAGKPTAHVRHEKPTLPASGANARSVWTIPTEPTPFAHFATWPQALCRRMILAGTSERGVCPECGGPWVREVERTGFPDPAAAGEDTTGRMKGSGEVATDSARRSVLSGARHAAFKAQNPDRDLGWRPSCDHGAQPVPATCLDVFGGSGTTALVARKLGRRAILIELNPDYCKLAAGRLSQQSLFAVES